MTQEDFSRFGRNSIETGYFIERVLPLFHTRFISISDDFDSSKFKGDTGGMDVAFKYLISEYYSRDMSIKTKSAKYAKMQRGEYQSKICPYGYRKSADGRMEPDPEAAAVVQLIFQLAAEMCIRDSRLNTICQADQILVIADGRISEQGTHDELIAKAGIYQDFVNIRKKSSGWSLA